MASTRWGILSAGKISHDFVSCLRSIEGHSVNVVAAKNVDNAKVFAKLHNIATVLDNYEDMAAQDVDVVYCGSLNPQHYPLVKHLLQNGKPVFCEKPLTMSLKHTEELVKIAREKKVFLMEAMWSRFLPVYEEMTKRVDSIGDIQQVEVAFGLRQIQDSKRVTTADLGGSSILDIGVYAINFAQMIFKDEFPVEIRAVGEVTAEGVDLQTGILLKYASGKFASLTTSVTADLTCEATAYGSKGSLKLHKHFWCTDSMEVNGEKVHIPFPDTVTPCNYTNSSGLRYEAMHVRECLQKGLTESPVMTLDVSLNCSRIMQTCLDQMGAKLRV